MPTAFLVYFLHVPRKRAERSYRMILCALLFLAGMLPCGIFPVPAQGQEVLPGELRAPINPAGPEAWPAARGLGSRPVLSPLASGGAVRRPLSFGNFSTSDLLSPQAQWNVCQDAMRAGRYAHALEELGRLYTASDLSPQLRADVLYAMSDCLWQLRTQPSPGGSDLLLAVTGKALTADARHASASQARVRLAMLDLECGRLEEGRSAILQLLRDHPRTPDLSPALVVLGQAQLRAGKFEAALESFGTVLRRQAGEDVLEEATVGLIMALIQLGRHTEAAPFVEVAQKRWPRCYLRHEDFLTLLASHQLALARNDAARETLWLAVNLDPAGSLGNGTWQRLAAACEAAGHPQDADRVRQLMARSAPRQQAVPGSVSSRSETQQAHAAGAFCSAH